jgi:predicted nucleotidyltransferase
MNAKDREIGHRLKNRLQERINLHQVIVFGSRARGDAESDSDMDVLIVLNEPVSRRTRKIVSDNGVVVVPIVVSRDGWENGPDRASLLAMAVREEGMCI